MARLLESLLKLRPEEASFSVRGFEVSDPVMVGKLEKMLESFIGGYNLAVSTPDHAELSRRLYDSYDNHHVGFAFEGVGLWLALLDLMVPGRAHRLGDYFKGAGERHDFIVAVGAGFAIARVPWGRLALNRYLRTVDPLIGWCVPCGYGFHEAFFHHQRFVEEAQEPPASLSPLGKQLFDSGLGRALWWVKCADARKIKLAIDRFPEPRRAELWAGIGIASCYAGGVGVTQLMTLRDLSGSYQADFLSGMPFAARLRQKAGNYSEVTELACSVLLGQSTDQTADMAEAAAEDVRSEVRGEGITEVYALLRRQLVKECRKRERVVLNG